MKKNVKISRNNIGILERKKTAEKNSIRASEVYAQTVFEKLLPDFSVRFFCANIIRDSIQIAHSIAPSCWTITLFPNLIRLSVGSVEVFVIKKGLVKIFTCSGNEQGILELIDKKIVTQLGNYYKSMPVEQLACRISPSQIVDYYPNLRDLHHEYVQLAAKNKKVTTWKSSFSVGLILYLDSLLNVSLPLPMYYFHESKNFCLYPDQIDDKANFYEGNIVNIKVNRFERDPEAREQCIQFWGSVCQVCGFDFELRYGLIGKGFIHIHHVHPLSTIRESYQVDPKTDLIPVCPNCHAMLHRKKPPYTINELKALLVRIIK